MQQINTSVLARRIVLNDMYTTQPYEAGWANEAVIFVQVEGTHPDLSLTAEISPDGINWLQRGAAVRLTAAEAIAELAVANFGNWLRLRVVGATSGATARILVHLVAKG